MPVGDHTTYPPYVHPDDPAGKLKPGDRLEVHGYDWSWCHVIFREIPGFPGYAVGSNNTYWSRRPRNGHGPLLEQWRSIRPTRMQGRYLYLSLPGKTRGRQDLYLAHRLILLAFFGPCPDGMECRHLNNDKTDNRLANLAWGTKEENMADQREHGVLRQGSTIGTSKLTETQVGEIKGLLAGVLSQQAIADRYQVSQATISDIDRGERWKHVPSPPL